MPAWLEALPQDQPAVRRALLEGRRLVIGRADDADLRVESDLHLSRRHVEVRLDAGLLRVKRLQGASNPVYHGGIPQDEFSVRPGEHFLIGKTRFLFQTDAGAQASAAAADAPERDPLALKTISAQDLYSIAPGGSDRLRLLDLLELPEILRRRDRQGFHAHIARLLRQAAGASWACVATESGELLGQSAADRAARGYAPSRALIRKALEDAPQPTLYSWSAPGGLKATVYEGLDWAVCAAARVPGQPALIFYAAGAGAAPPGPEEAKFVGLVADMVGRSVSLDRLLTMEGRLERFFSGPVVSKILKSPDLAELEPRLARSTVLFFDIRGFSRRTEENNEEVLAYISELRRALSSMTQIILEEGGVVLQYMGDGLLACWNVPYEDARHVDLACRAALRMAETFASTTPGWGCGIGLHSGEVVAGAIGSEQVFAYGVLGTVVNQASRIEGITKVLRAPILVTAEVARQLSPETGACLRVGRFQPAGMTEALELFELCRPPVDPARQAAFAAFHAAFERADWAAAAQALASRPTADGPASFLRACAETAAAHPPLHWRGVIELTQK